MIVNQIATLYVIANNNINNNGAHGVVGYHARLAFNRACGRSPVQFRVCPLSIDDRIFLAMPRPMLTG